MLFAGDLRAGFLTAPCEEKRQRKPKYDPVKANSSLVSGFDSSTENQVDFKRLKDKKFCCTIPCEDDSCVRLWHEIRSPGRFLPHSVTLALAGVHNLFACLFSWESPAI
jgi:hypothetical protein